MLVEMGNVFVVSETVPGGVPLIASSRALDVVLCGSVTQEPMQLVIM